MAVLVKVRFKKLINFASLMMIDGCCAVWEGKKGNTMLCSYDDKISIVDLGS